MSGIPWTRGQYPYTPWSVRIDVSLEAVDDAHVRRLRHGRRHERAVQGDHQVGGDGLSTAFDMPTLLGLDSDDPMSLGEVGRCGVAVDTLADMEDLYAASTSATITTSMTINSPAAPIFAMFVAQAEKAGAPRSSAARCRTTS
jgi:methylmalonyl-CoA mutase N-terminal domain/subunit